MPKVNATLLDRLISEGRIKTKPAIIQQTTFRDPLGYTMEQRRAITRNPQHFQKLDMTPERSIYQRGLEDIRGRNVTKAEEQLSDFQGDLESLQDDWNDAVESAKESMLEDWRTGVEDYDFSEIDPDYLDVDEPSTNLGDYWDADRTPEEFYDAQERLRTNIDEYEDIVAHRESPKYLMELQRQSPRYRNYQRAMQQRAANKRYGHMIAREEAKRRQLDAYVRDMLRSGMTMEDIRNELGAVRSAVPGSQNYNDLRQTYGPSWSGLKRTLRGGR